MAHEEAVAAIQTMFDAFNAGDLDRAVSVIGAGAVLTDVPMGMTLQGPEGVRQWFATFKTAGPDAQANLERLIVTDDWIASEHVGRFTHTGPLATPNGEVPPTGKQVEIRMAEFYQVRDGKVTEMRAYYDAATLMRQLGLMG